MGAQIGSVVTIHMGPFNVSLDWGLTGCEGKSYCICLRPIVSHTSVAIVCLVFRIFWGCWV